MPEIDTLLGQIVPAVEAAVSAYGVGVLTKAEDGAADATVRLGQKLLSRILHRSAHADRVREAVTDLAENAEDPDTLASLRLQIRKALGDPEFAAELSTLLPERTTVRAEGARSVAVGGSNSGIISTGDGATNTLHQ